MYMMEYYSVIRKEYIWISSNEVDETGGYYTEWSKPERKTPIQYTKGNGTPLQHSCLENPMDRGAWKAAVHGVAKSWTQLSDFTFTFHFHALEKEMATHSSIPAWRIPGMEETGRPQSMGSQRVGHDWTTSLHFTSLHFTSYCIGVFLSGLLHSV